MSPWKWSISNLSLQNSNKHKGNEKKIYQLKYTAQDLFDEKPNSSS